MSRIQTGVAEAIQLEKVRVVIDINPSPVDNKRFADEAVPGEGRAQVRLKNYLSEHGVRYFTVGEINTSQELAGVIADYAANNLGEDEQFIVICDRKPGDLNEVLGPLNGSLAGWHI